MGKLGGCALQLNIPFVPKNTPFQCASFREGYRWRRLQEMTLPALLKTDILERERYRKHH